MKVLRNLVYWLFISTFYVQIRFFHPLELHIDFSEVFIHGCIAGLCLGLVFGLLEYFRVFESKKRVTFQYIIFFKSIIYLLIFISGMVASASYGNSVEVMMDYLFSYGALLVLVYLSFCGIIYHATQELNRKFGPGMMKDFILGKYYSPKEESRVFMFLDLQSSTTIAEKLGHKKYSEFIQDCFIALNSSLLKNKGQIYQYVGDEAVVTWLMKDGIKNQRILHLFFDYQISLQLKKTYFLDKYGEMPSFKAGVSSGGVMVAEVGVLKAEIAFHGDVLNTAARLQEMCKVNKEDFIIDRKTLEILDDISEFNCIDLGKFQLRGKIQKIDIVGVYKNDANSK